MKNFLKTALLFLTTGTALTACNNGQTQPLTAEQIERAKIDSLNEKLKPSYDDIDNRMKPYSHSLNKKEGMGWDKIAAAEGDSLQPILKDFNKQYSDIYAQNFEMLQGQQVVFMAKIDGHFRQIKSLQY